jgi:F-type H+-transporting ATPase subunit a
MLGFVNIAHAAEGGGLKIALKAEPVFLIGDFAITGTLILTWVIVALLSVMAFLVGSNIKKIPSRTQAFFELIFSGALDYIETVLEDRKLALRFFPLIATLFIFILVANLLGLVPGIKDLMVHTSQGWVHLFHPITTDLNTTIALAIIAFLSIEIAGVAMIGALKYGGKFVNFSSVIGFLVGIIELVSELARLIAFSFRLFGNMFAGKVLLLVIMFFVPLLVPVPILLFEVFVAFIQASIFALLTLFFIKIAIAEPH